MSPRCGRRRLALAKVTAKMQKMRFEPEKTWATPRAAHGWLRHWWQAAGCPAPPKESRRTAFRTAGRHTASLHQGRTMSVVKQSSAMCLEWSYIMEQSTSTTEPPPKHHPKRSPSPNLPWQSTDRGHPLGHPHLPRFWGFVFWLGAAIEERFQGGRWIQEISRGIDQEILEALYM